MSSHEPSLPIVSGSGILTEPFCDREFWDQGNLAVALKKLLFDDGFDEVVLLSLAARSLVGPDGSCE